jgi:hypothetical protein
LAPLVTFALISRQILKSLPAADFSSNAATTIAAATH